MFQSIMNEMNKYNSKIEFCLSSSFITFIKELLLVSQQISISYDFDMKYNAIDDLFDWSDEKLKIISTQF